MTASGILGLAIACPALAQTGTDHLAPQTKLRLTVVQFMPSTGDYKRWDAVGGDLVVGPDGSITVPTLGVIPVGNFNADQLADEISSKLQTKLGLIERPDASVQIVEYPPIFLVGSVSTPGQYPFRPGMTVLQAVALGGGQFRGDSQSNPDNTIKLQSELQRNARDTLRSTAKLSRLQAELSDAKEITFPASLDSADPAVTEILNQERTIFAARQNEQTRQVTALTDLIALFKAEIDVLQQKSDSIDDELKQALQQQSGVKQLVEKGVATVARQSDVDRAVAGFRSDRLDNMIATMTARQGLSETTRNLAKLEDDQHAQVAIELQAEQTNLERLDLSQVTNMRLLRQATEFASNTDNKTPVTESLSYSILREQDGKPTAIAATELTTLMPGDLLKVSLALGPIAPGQGGAGPVASR